MNGVVRLSMVGILLLAGTTFGRQIWMAGEGFNPDPNQEVTVYLQTDTPLFCLGVFFQLTGDATIKGTMSEADSAVYGWDPWWTGAESIDDVNGFADFCGVSWAADANGTVGYIKFIYHSGEVSLSMGGDCYGADFNSVPASSEALVFGQVQNNMASGSSQLIPSMAFEASSGSTLTIPADTASMPKYSRYPTDGNARYFNPVADVQPNTALFLPEASFSTPDMALAAPSYSTLNSSSWLIYDANTILTENTIWEGNVLLNGTIFVEGCMLVIMPGTTIYNSYYGSGIIVRNGGVLAANGTSDAHIRFLSDWGYETPYQWGLYLFAVTIESTASPASSVSYCDIWSAVWGIFVADCRLEKPLEQITTWYCCSGITEVGPNLTDIINNEILHSLTYPIVVSLVGLPDPNDPNNFRCSAETFIAVEHNTILTEYYIDEELYGHVDGITVYGSRDPNRAGTVAMADNLIAGSARYAVLMEYWINCSGRWHNGYYRNRFIDPNDEFGEPWGDVNPQYVNRTARPLLGEGVLGSWPYYLAPDSNFVDKGAMSVEESGYLIGQSTTISGAPDVGMADIGHHYNFEGYVNAGVNPNRADINCDFGVDANDLLLFSGHWLEDANSPGYDARMEFVDANRVDFHDFAAFAKEWKKRFRSIPPDTAPGFDMDQNNLKGDVTVAIPEPKEVRRSFLVMDGKILKEFGELDEPNTFSLPTATFPSGLHTFKIIYITDNNDIYMTTPADANFTNLFHEMDPNEDFHPARSANLVFSGYYYGSQMLTATITDDINDVSVWSNTYSGHSLRIVVPGSVFGDSQLCTLRITEDSNLSSTAMRSGEESSVAEMSDKEIKKVLKKTFRSEDWSGLLRMVIVMPNWDYYYIRRDALIACAKACQARNVPWTGLYRHNVTESNLIYLLRDRPDVQYIYWAGHADSNVPWPNMKGVSPVRRTRVTYWQYFGSKWLGTRDDWRKKPAFSYTQRSVSDADALPYPWDRLGESLDFSQLGMVQSNRKKIVFFDGCYSAFNDDMARAFGMYSVQGASSNDQIFVGWRSPVMMGWNEWGELFRGNTTKGMKLFWDRMGAGDTVYNAVAYIESHAVTELQLRAFFGTNMQFDGVESSDDNIMLYGKPGGIHRKLDR